MNCQFSPIIDLERVGFLAPVRGCYHVSSSFRVSIGNHKLTNLLLLTATSHLSQEPWPYNCESPKESAQRPSQDTSKIMYCDHRPSSVVWSHMWPSRQPNATGIREYRFNGMSVHASPRTRYNGINQRLWAFWVPWSPGFVLGHRVSWVYGLGSSMTYKGEFHVDLLFTKV